MFQAVSKIVISVVTYSYIWQVDKSKYDLDSYFVKVWESFAILYKNSKITKQNQETIYNLQSHLAYPTVSINYIYSVEVW